MFKNNPLKRAVEKEKEDYLIQYLDFNVSKRICSSHYILIEEALIGTWHSQHEDLVNMIYFEKLRDDRFVEPILNIALNKEVFRWYDDELEATLRKCVHALKTIDSLKSKDALKKLEDLNNENVKITLEMYS
jgi:hypothetical protein